MCSELTSPYSPGQALDCHQQTLHAHRMREECKGQERHRHLTAPNQANLPTRTHSRCEMTDSLYFLHFSMWSAHGRGGGRETFKISILPLFRSLIVLINQITGWFLFCLCVCVCLHECGGHRLMLEIFLDHTSFCILSQNLSLKPELHVLSSLTS